MDSPASGGARAAGSGGLAALAHGPGPSPTSEIIAKGGAADAPCRAPSVLEAFGCPTEPRFVEGMRAKAKRLVERGQVEEVARGSFALGGGGR